MFGKTMTCPECKGSGTGEIWGEYTTLGCSLCGGKTIHRTGFFGGHTTKIIPGSGRIDVPKESCPSCKGSGYQERVVNLTPEYRNKSDEKMVKYPCGSCHGSGYKLRQ